MHDQNVKKAAVNILGTCFFFTEFNAVKRRMIKINEQ